MPNPILFAAANHAMNASGMGGLGGMGGMGFGPMSLINMLSGGGMFGSWGSTFEGFRDGMRSAMRSAMDPMYASSFDQGMKAGGSLMAGFPLS